MIFLHILMCKNVYNLQVLHLTKNTAILLRKQWKHFYFLFAMIICQSSSSPEKNPLDLKYLCSKTGQKDKYIL